MQTAPAHQGGRRFHWRRRLLLCYRPFSIGGDANVGLDHRASVLDRSHYRTTENHYSAGIDIGKMSAITRTLGICSGWGRCARGSVAGAPGDRTIRDRELRPRPLRESQRACQQPVTQRLRHLLPPWWMGVASCTYLVKRTYPRLLGVRPDPMRPGGRLGDPQRCAILPLLSHPQLSAH